MTDDEKTATTEQLKRIGKLILHGPLAVDTSMALLKVAVAAVDAERLLDDLNYSESSKPLTRAFSDLRRMRFPI